MDRPARGIFICATTWCVFLSAAKHSLLVRFDSSSRDNLANSRPVTAALFTEEPSGMTSKMPYARYTATPLRASCIGVNDGSGAERDRKSVVKGKSVDLGGRRIMKKKNK